MNIREDLEQFRERWQRELLHEHQRHAGEPQETDGCGRRRDDAESSFDRRRKRRKFGEMSSSYDVGEDDDLDECKLNISKPDIAAEALSIADDLLNGNHSKDTSTKDRRSNKINVGSANDCLDITDELSQRKNPENLLETLIADLVSVSWRSLADDDVLWCKVCHKLGYHTDVHAGDKINWKGVVKECLEGDTRLRTNWKGRIGGVLTLEYVEGGILTSVQSCDGYIIAGYSSGSVKLWDIDNNNSESLLTSHQSIGLDQKDRPAINHVATNRTVGMATYSSGDVDVWNYRDNTTIIHNFHHDEDIHCVAMAMNDAVIATAAGHIVRIDVSDVNGYWKCQCRPRTEKPISFMKFVPTSKSSSSSDLHIVMATDSAMGGIYHYPINSLSNQVIKLHQLIAPATCLDVDSQFIACGINSTGFQESFTVKILDLEKGGILNSLRGHSWGVSCLNLAESPTNMIVTGCKDKKVRMYDLRSGESPVMSLYGHAGSVTSVQMDDWKIVSGGHEGMLCVWDLKMASKLWETYARHPVRHCHFDKSKLISAHIPQLDVYQQDDDFEIIKHKRQRGEIRVYNFLLDHTSEGLPSICQSSYNEPIGYNYNIRLAVPYDNVI
ncbi:F-box/WD repeat-containing protein 8-like isoform X2 [Glandiceps talaboti]